MSDTIKPMFVLRDLPGVAKIEAFLEAADRHPNPLWSKELKELEEAKALVEPTSRRLFGITDDETSYIDDPALSGSENEDRYEVWEDLLELMGRVDEDKVAAAWRKLGWDVWDRDGRRLRCLDHFVRQMVTVTTGRAGHFPGVAVELDDQQQKDLASKLEREAADFRGRRREGRPK